MRKSLTIAVAAFVLGFSVRAVTAPSQSRHAEPAGLDLSQPILVRNSPSEEGVVYVPFAYKTEGQREVVVGPPPEDANAVCFVWFDNGRTLVKATRQPDSRFVITK